MKIEFGPVIVTVCYLLLIKGPSLGPLIMKGLQNSNKNTTQFKDPVFLSLKKKCNVLLPMLLFIIIGYTNIIQNLNSWSY